MPSPRQITLWFVTVFVALAPIPLGSNRPFFWGLNGVLLALLTMVYLSLSRSMENWLSLRVFRWPALLILLTIAWMALQIVPIPQHLAPDDTWSKTSRILGVTLPARVSIEPAATVWMLIRYLSYSLLFLIAAGVSVNAYRAKQLLLSCYIITVLHAAYAILSLLVMQDKILFLFPKWTYLGYATGFFVNRNSFATFSALGWVIGTALFLNAVGIAGSSKDPETKTWSWDDAPAILALATGWVILAVALLLSGSRMGIAAALTGQIVVLIMAYTRSRDNRLIVLSAAAVVCAAALFWLSGDRLVGRIASMDDSAGERLLLYRQVLSMIQSRPWTGFGGGTFPEAFPLFHAPPLSADATFDAAHNLYLELLADLGVVGLLPPLAVLMMCVTMVRSMRVTRSAPLALAPVGAVVVGALHSLTDFSLQIQANVFLFVVLLAIGIAQSGVRST